MNSTERAVFQALIDTGRAAYFNHGYQASNAEVVGLLLSKFFHFDGYDILKAAESALEDANFHTESGQVAALAEALVKVDDGALIDSLTRSALFAALGEVYPGISKDRERRLAKLNLLANRPADDPITSLSDRRCNMTMGDARRVFDMIEELREARGDG